MQFFLDLPCNYITKRIPGGAFEVWENGGMDYVCLIVFNALVQKWAATHNMIPPTAESDSYRYRSALEAVNGYKGLRGNTKQSTKKS